MIGNSYRPDYRQNRRLSTATELFSVTLCLCGEIQCGAVFRYSAGMGLSGRSESQEIVRIHQRAPSLSSSTLLMPRSKGSALASWREAYVVNTWAMLPNCSVWRAISDS